MGSERKRRRPRRPEQLRQRVLASSSFSGFLVGHQMASHCLVNRTRTVSLSRPCPGHWKAITHEAHDLPRRRLTCWWITSTSTGAVADREPMVIILRRAAGRGHDMKRSSCGLQGSGGSD